MLAVFIRADVSRYAFGLDDFHSAFAVGTKIGRGNIPRNEFAGRIISTRIESRSLFGYFLYYISAARRTFCYRVAQRFGISAFREVGTRKKFSVLGISHYHVRAALFADNIGNFFFGFDFISLIFYRQNLVMEISVKSAITSYHLILPSSILSRLLSIVAVNFVFMMSGKFFY